MLAQKKIPDFFNIKNPWLFPDQFHFPCFPGLVGTHNAPPAVCKNYQSIISHDSTKVKANSDFLPGKNSLEFACPSECAVAIAAVLTTYL